MLLRSTVKALRVSLVEPVAYLNDSYTTLAVGLKITLMRQLVPPKTVEPHVFVWLKSLVWAPVVEMLEIASGALPVLLSVAVWAELEEPIF